MANNGRGPDADMLIDLRNAAVCLACPLADYGLDCVYVVDYELEVRSLCPIWWDEKERDTAAKRRARERRLAKRGRLAGVGA